MLRPSTWMRTAARAGLCQPYAGGTRDGLLSASTSMAAALAVDFFFLFLPGFSGSKRRVSGFTGSSGSRGAAVLPRNMSGQRSQLAVQGAEQARRARASAHWGEAG